MKKRRASLDIHNLSISHHRVLPSSSSPSSNNSAHPNMNSSQPPLNEEDEEDYSPTITTTTTTTTSSNNSSKNRKTMMKNTKSKRKKEMVLNICPPSSLGHDSLGDDDMDENGNFNVSQPRSALLPPSIDYFAEDEAPCLSLPDDAENIIKRDKALTLSDIEEIEKQYQDKSVGELNVLLCETIKEVPFSENFFNSTLSKCLRTLNLSGGHLETVDLIFYFKSLPFLREISFSNNTITELVHSDYLNDSRRVKELEKILPKSLIEIDLSWNYISQFPSLDLVTLLQKKGIKFDIRFNCISELPKEFLYEADEALSDSEYSKPKSKTTCKFVALNHNTLFDLRNTIVSCFYWKMKHSQIHILTAKQNFRQSLCGFYAIGEKCTFTLQCPKCQVCPQCFKFYHGIGTRIQRKKVRRIF